MGAGTEGGQGGGATPPAGGGATPPAGADAGGAAPAAGSGDTHGSQRQVLADLAEERKSRQRLEQELADLKARTQTEAEKAVEKARKEGEDLASTKFATRMVKSEARAYASGKVADVEDAVTLLGDLERFVVKGEPDTKAISSAIDELLKTKPYLAAKAGKPAPSPLPGGGARPAGGVSMNDEIRRRAGRL